MKCGEIWARRARTSARLRRARDSSRSASSSWLETYRATSAEARTRSEAEQIAERILKAGSDLFDAKNAEALAATYTADGAIHLIDTKEGQPNDNATRGRADITQFYRDTFKDAGTIDSENTVEFARFVAPDLLVIHGRFRPNTGEIARPFVQMRVKTGDRWLLNTLWLFLSDEKP